MDENKEKCKQKQLLKQTNRIQEGKNRKGGLTKIKNYVHVALSSNI